MRYELEEVRNGPIIAKTVINWLGIETEGISEEKLDEVLSGEPSEEVKELRDENDQLEEDLDDLKARAEALTKLVDDAYDLLEKSRVPGAKEWRAEAVKLAAREVCGQCRSPGHPTVNGRCKRHGLRVVKR